MSVTALNRQSIIILDNACFYRMAVLQEMANLFDHIVLLFAPLFYLRGLNPIKKAWANIKRYMHMVLPDLDCFIHTLISYSHCN